MVLSFNQISYITAVPYAYVLHPLKRVVSTLQVDVTHLIEGHSSYLWTTRQILDLIELDNYDTVISVNLGKR